MCIAGSSLHVCRHTFLRHLSSYLALHGREPHLPLPEPPSPCAHEERDIKEAEHERPPPKDNGVIRPRVVGRDAHLADRDRPRQHPEDVGRQRLVEVPQRSGGQEERC